MIDNTKFISLIKEGLIRTWNILKYESNLIIELERIGLKFDINVINKFSYEISIYNIDWFRNKNVLNQFFRINVNLLGYYPSSFFVFLKNKMSKNYNYNETDFNNSLYFKNIDKIKILFNST